LNLYILYHFSLFLFVLPYYCFFFNSFSHKVLGINKEKNNFFFLSQIFLLFPPHSTQLYSVNKKIDNDKVNKKKNKNIKSFSKRKIKEENSNDDDNNNLNNDALNKGDRSKIFRQIKILLSEFFSLFFSFFNFKLVILLLFFAFLFII
jgi:hypothetical protein